MTILFAGGGTLGPVTPLLAVARRMKALRPNVEFAWAGTKDGPERDLVERERIPFFVIPTAKLPRSFSLEWFAWLGRYFAAQRAAKDLIDRIKPSLVVGAGGYTQVPVIREATKCGIPCAIHQLDVVPGLSNRAVARKCTSVTTSFSYARPPFGGVSSDRVSTPCRFAKANVPDKEGAASRFFLEPNEPIVFVVGGGTGAQAINDAIHLAKNELTKIAQIIHATGKGKKGIAQADRRYVVKEFLDEQDTLFAYAAADVVVCRAGMGTLSDAATLQKSVLAIPMPDSHQEKNAQALREGISVLHQTQHLAAELTQEIDELLQDSERRKMLGAKLRELLPTDDGKELAERWLRLN